MQPESKEITASRRTTAILFGRFQPLSIGQVGLIRTIQRAGLDIHIVTNEKEDTAQERNPYTREQRRRMFALALPDIGDDHLHYTTVYLDRGGDIGPAVRELSRVFEGIAPLDRTIICYVEKGEDVKTYTMNGQTLDHVHYVDLFTHPHGKCGKWMIDPTTIIKPDPSVFEGAQRYLSDLNMSVSALCAPDKNATP
jgi:hypothetical protein